MLAELIELCLEPKRINDLQNLEFLFADQNDWQSQTDINEQNLNVDLDNQPARIPMPDIFPQQVQQLNINQDYQLPLQQQQYNQELLNDNNHVNRNFSINRNQSNNQQNSNDKILKSNSSSPSSSKLTKYGDDICSCNNLNNLHNLSNKNISKKITDDINWQSDLTSVRSRNAALFNNDYMSDVTFIVGDCDMSDNKNNNLTNNKLIRIPAHKYILSTGSSVFYAMFYGPLAENSKEIRLIDDDAQGILTLFRYLYCDDICLNKDNVVDTFYVSTKYFVPYLTRACINYLTHILNSQNACNLLCQIRLYDETELINQLYDVIDAQSQQALESESFVDIDEGTLELILKRETLHSTTEENIELIIFNALNRWSEKECLRRKLEINLFNKRKILEKLIYLIRIPTMSLNDFANSVAQSKLLDPDTTTNLFLYYTASAKNQLTESIDKFNFKKRKGLELNSVQRFQSSVYRANMWKYKGRSDSVNFCVDKKIFLGGLGLYGSTEVCSVYKLKMELKRNNKLLAYKSDLNLVSDGTSKYYKFMFDHSIEIKPNILYTASVTIDGSSLSYFGQDGLAEVTWKKANKFVTFNFQCCNSSTNGTGVIGGQIPELLFYLPSLDNELLNKNIE